MKAAFLWVRPNNNPVVMDTDTQITKRQHFVPQFYLRKFLNHNNEVEVFDCDQKRILAPRGTQGICYDNFFYGMTTGKSDEVSQYIEKGFQQMEKSVSDNIDSVITKILANEQILDDEKWLVALLMSMLWIRGPAMRERINQMSEQMMKQIMKFQFNIDAADALFDRFDQQRREVTAPEERKKIREAFLQGDYSLSFDNVTHLRFFEEMQGFANLFWGQDWMVFISKTDSKFMTSDNPVAVILPKRKGFYGPTFLERTHYLSLTPDICIETRYPIKDSGKKLRRKTLFKGDEGKILGLNLTIAGQAWRYAYATWRQSLEEILGESKRQEAFFATPEGKKIKQMLEEGR